MMSADWFEPDNFLSAPKKPKPQEPFFREYGQSAQIYTGQALIDLIGEKTRQAEALMAKETHDWGVAFYAYQDEFTTLERANLTAMAHDDRKRYRTYYHKALTGLVTRLRNRWTLTYWFTTRRRFKRLRRGLQADLQSRIASPYDQVQREELARRSAKACVGQRPRSEPRSKLYAEMGSLLRLAEANPDQEFVIPIKLMEAFHAAPVPGNPNRPKVAATGGGIHTSLE